MLDCWPLFIIAGSWFWAVLLWLRLAQYQTEHPGVPYMWNWKYFNPNNFTPEGQPLLRQLWITQLVFLAGAILAMIYCV